MSEKVKVELSDWQLNQLVSLLENRVNELRASGLLNHPLTQDYYRLIRVLREAYDEQNT